MVCSRSQSWLLIKPELSEHRAHFSFHLARACPGAHRNHVCIWGRPGRHPQPAALTRALLSPLTWPSGSCSRGGTTHICPGWFGNKEAHGALRCGGLPVSSGSVLELEGYTRLLAAGGAKPEVVLGAGGSPGRSCLAPVPYWAQPTQRLGMGCGQDQCPPFCHKVVTPLGSGSTPPRISATFPRSSYTRAQILLTWLLSVIGQGQVKLRFLACKMGAITLLGVAEGKKGSSR